MSMYAHSHAHLSSNVSVGLIQTSLDFYAAWNSSPKMDKVEEERAISEIRKFVAAFRQEKRTPDIVLIPELAVPRGFEYKLRSMATTLQTIIVAGMDYRFHSSGGKSVSNEAIIIVPSRWQGVKIGPKTTARYVGKAYAAPEEENSLNKIGFGFQSSPAVWVFDGGRIGKFGVAICYDFLDLDRLAMYRGQIQHLFILAYNKDIPSFDHVAQAMARMIFCNVVVCNCGYYGGSQAVSPYRRPERRTIYRHSGSGLATAQIISLPVLPLRQHQDRAVPPTTPEEDKFKNLPPGFGAPVTLKGEVEELV